ncbi:MAG: serine--tRNA ligase [Elusimicrobiota bacterium]|jgi:seryl-tRNA synthetase
MNDPRLLRTETDRARKSLRSRNERYIPLLDSFLSLDGEHRALMQEVEALRAKRNEVSKSVGAAKARKDDEAAKRLMEEVSLLKQEMPKKEEKLSGLDARVREELLSLPNLPHESSPVGRSEEDNRIVRSSGEPDRLSFKAADHASFGEKLGLLDFALAAKLSGARFAVLKGAGARLERSLAQFMLDHQTRENGYIEHWVPYLVRAEALEGTGQLPKFEADLYKTGQAEEKEGESSTAKDIRYLIPTAEVPLTNLVRGEILEAAKLPLKFTALTPCFRQESGSYGKDVKGLIRNHQFDKVELVWIARPEDSMEALEQLTRDAESVLQKLRLPYRVIELCTGDLGFGACKTYDLEVFFQGEGRYREVSSCSNCWDFQARRMNARMKRGLKDVPEFVHTLNGSGLAVGRILAAILENYQQADGSLLIPEVLRSYFGSDRITP